MILLSRIYLNKQYDQLAKFTPHSGDLTDFKFGEYSKYIVSAGSDRKLVITGEKEL